jgi:hypothetical protein
MAPLLDVSGDAALQDLGAVITATERVSFSRPLRLFRAAGPSADESTLLKAVGGYQAERGQDTDLGREISEPPTMMIFQN